MMIYLPGLGWSDEPDRSAVTQHQLFKATMEYHLAVYRLLQAIEISGRAQNWCIGNDVWLTQCVARTMRAYVCMTGKEIR